MTKQRLEAFSDGVLAVAITIMVLELKPPHGSSVENLRPLANTFVSYVLSFLYLGIYWNNHHHMMLLTHRINGKILWANLNLLFWLTLIPFVTGWLGETHFAKAPAAAYGVVLLMAGIAYWILQTCIIRFQGPASPLAEAIGRDVKGKISPLIYIVAIASSCLSEWISMSLYWLAAAMWFIPDRRIESRLHSAE